jgi:hypothetical protein
VSGDIEYIVLAYHFVFRIIVQLPQQVAQLSLPWAIDGCRLAWCQRQRMRQRVTERSGARERINRPVTRHFGDNR